jgi:hypothetical protein
MSTIDHVCDAVKKQATADFPQFCIENATNPAMSFMFHGLCQPEERRRYVGLVSERLRYAEGPADLKPLPPATGSWSRDELVKLIAVRWAVVSSSDRSPVVLGPFHPHCMSDAELRDFIAMVMDIGDDGEKIASAVSYMTQRMTRTAQLLFCLYQLSLHWAAVTCAADAATASIGLGNVFFIVASLYAEHASINPKVPFADLFRYYLPRIYDVVLKSCTDDVKDYAKETFDRFSFAAQ